MPGFGTVHLWPPGRLYHRHDSPDQEAHGKYTDKAQEYRENVCRIDLSGRCNILGQDHYIQATEYAGNDQYNL